VADSGDDATIKTLLALHFSSFSTLPLIFSPFSLASGLVILRTGVIWRPLGWLGLALAVVAAISGATHSDGDPDGAFSWLEEIAFIGFLVWTALLSLGMILRKTDPG
jgi:hypothetical protein